LLWNKSASYYIDFQVKKILNRLLEEVNLYQTYREKVMTSVLLKKLLEKIKLNRNVTSAVQYGFCVVASKSTNGIAYSGESEGAGMWWYPH
jgi:hypothetical protein